MVPTWVPQAIYALTFPITGLVAGLAGIFYQKNLSFNKTKIFIYFHLVLAILFISPLVVSLISEEALDQTGIKPWVVYLCMGLTLFLLEIFFLYNYKKERSKNLNLIFTSVLIATVTRIINGFILTTYGDYYYWNTPFEFGLLSRVITSSYLIPGLSILSFVFIEAALYAKKVTNFHF